ncbi:hypothetical protein Bca4012_043771 [Brassica carinata]
MKLKISFLPVFLFSLIALDSASAQEICFNGFFKPNSTYDLNRRQVLSSLASNVTSHKGFFNSSIGENPNRVFIIGMCIPGTKPVTCSDCIKAASDTLLKSCPNQTEAYTWPDSCMVRYSNVPFSGSYDIGPSHVLYKSGVLNSNVTVFDRIGEDLMERTITEAPTRAHEHKYYTAGLASLTASLTMYAMMQCTPELSTGYCGLCLRTNLDNYKLCCRDKQGGSITRPSCFIRWDVHPFAGAFENLTLPPPQPQSLPQPPLSLPPPVSNPASKTDKDGEALSIGIIVAILVPIVVILVLLVVGFMVWRRSKAYQTVTIQAGDEIIPLNSLQFKFKTIEAATDKFSDSNMIGQGGFGEVYRAWRLWRNQSPLKLVDPAMGESYQNDEAFRCIHIALLCIQEDPADRPMLPAVILMLTDSITIPVLRTPRFCLSSMGDFASQSTLSSTNDQSIGDSDLP